MGNETELTTQTVQPLPQTHVTAPTPPSTKWVKILLFAILSLITVTVSVYAGIQIGKNQSVSQQSVIVQPTPLPTQTITPSYTSPTQTISPKEPTPIVTETVEPTSIAKIKISPLNTNDWKQVQNNGVFFKIPSNASCNSVTECTEVTYPNVYQGKTLSMPARILVNVTDYLGGSRRAQYLTKYKGIEDCKPIYVETLFGSINALQIAVDGGWCQGGYDGGIVAVIGKKFVVVGPGLNYNENKEISRWNERDTLISTLSSK